MKQAQMLRIYLLESDKLFGKPALDAVLEICKKEGLAGITVVRGIEGVGMHGTHTNAFLSLSSDLPLLLESIDTRDKISGVIERLRPHLGHRLIATWPVEIMRGNNEDDE